ncbi:MAG TPA: isochorismatase family protein [Actinomycetota bacterium]|nr:isochorismatase family protein [Actinomycetota bacterium]
MATYDAHTALLVVDVQNDFADPSGSLYVADGEQIVPTVNAEVERARAAGALVVYTQDWHPEHTPHFQRDGGIWPVHCVEDTPGAAFHPDLLVADHEVVRKGHDGRDGYSGFSVRDPLSGERGDTLLHEMLVANGIERLVICGLATDYCVVETVLDARMLGYPVEVLTDAVRPVELRPGDGATALARMRESGAELV